MLAFLFPGQGSQHAGMGAEVLQDPEIADLADRCAAAAGVDLRRLLTEAGDDELRLTTNAQPALLFMGVALARLLSRHRIRPAASHAPLVEPAGAALRSTLEGVDWRAPDVPVVATLTAQPYAGAGSIPGVLERQLSSPVRWADCVRRLRALGCERFVEVGPRRA